MECPQTGLWIRVWGIGYLWIVINGVLHNWYPYPIFGLRWIYIPSYKLKCGCNRIVFWFWTWYWYFGWNVYLPSQTCMNACPYSSNPNQLAFWNPLTCKCMCKRKCCYFPWQTMRTYPPCYCQWMIPNPLSF